MSDKDSASNTSLPSSTEGSPQPENPPIDQEALFLKKCRLTQLTDWVAQLPYENTTISTIAHPGHCQISQQSPPDFRWPDLHKKFSVIGNYTFTLHYPNGTKKTKETSFPWIIWDEPLETGEYQWSATYLNNLSQRIESSNRAFYISKKSISFLVDPIENLIEKVLAKPHPRAFPTGIEANELKASINGSRQTFFTSFFNTIKSNFATQPLDDPSSPLGAPQYATNRWVFQNDCGKLKYAAYAYLLTREAIYRDEAKRRIEKFVTWDPQGQSSHVNDDQLNRCVAHSLAFGFDALYNDLDSTIKTQIINQVENRLNQMSISLSMRYDSHGFTILQFLMASALSIAGDSNLATEIIRKYAHYQAQYINPWGGEDGGFSNGTDYNNWGVILTFELYDLIRWAGGPNIYLKPWTRNLGEYLIYFNPPQAPNVTNFPKTFFGDGAYNSAYSFDHTNQIYFLHYHDNPFYKWYISKMTITDNYFYSSWSMLSTATTPGFKNYNPNDAPLPPETPQSKLFPSIGWSAHHSDLEDENRTSFYFKSSPYGSYNHSYADQNSFVIHNQKAPLLTNSGYYDYYGSPHHTNWAKLSQSKNTITVDGGKGQSDISGATGSITASGDITQFIHKNNYDIITGNASRAYPGLLKKFIRSTIYFKPNQFLIIDDLESDTNRTWEWNIHALNTFSIINTTTVKTVYGSAQACLHMIKSPGVSFTQNNSYPVDPGGSFLNLWHGRFSTNVQSKKAQMVTWIDLTCSSDRPEIDQSEKGILVRYKNNIFYYSIEKMNPLN